MGRKKIFCTLLLLLCILFSITTTVSAINTGFSTETLPEKDVQSFLENVNIQLFTEEPVKNSIQCFDVNESGTIAIGCNNLDSKTVCIYSSDGNFQYGYTFKSSGNFDVELDNDTLIIYFVRSDIAVALDSDGQVESVLKIQNTLENNSYWRNVVSSNSRKVGNSEYTLSNNMGFFNLFASSYSELSVTNENGEKIVLYDVGSITFLRMLVAFIAILSFIIAGVLKIRKDIIKYNSTVKTDTIE